MGGNLHSGRSTSPINVVRRAESREVIALAPESDSSNKVFGKKPGHQANHSFSPEVCLEGESNEKAAMPVPAVMHTLGLVAAS